MNYADYNSNKTTKKETQRDDTKTISTIYVHTYCK